MHANEGAEEREEEAATEVTDSSSVSPEGFQEEEEAARSRPAMSPHSTVSTCSQDPEQLEGNPAASTSPGVVPDIIAASPSSAPKQRHSPVSSSGQVEGGCPSSCLPEDNVGAGTRGEQVLKGIRRRWQQASLARAETSSEELSLKAANLQQRQLEVERPAIPGADGRGALKAAATKHSAVKSKPSKPLAVLQSIAEHIENTPEQSALRPSRRSAPCGHTGLVGLAELPPPTDIKDDPYSPDDDPRAAGTASQTSPMEITLGDEGEHAGLAETDLAVQSEQRATQELYRFQKYSILALGTDEAEQSKAQSISAAAPNAEQNRFPSALPVSVYANLPIEWPLARISVYMRHINVLLRVTLHRRLAELSFRGWDFRLIPREVVKHVKEDFDTICGAMATQLAALFAFLKPSKDVQPMTGQEDVALYADPAYWLYGLLSFCAKSCEAKTTEAGGEPDFRTSKERKQDSTSPALEPTRNSLALMQTVVMSFARGLYLGKPELPIDHVHIYFPARMVHKVVSHCEALRLGEPPLDACKRYKHNVDNAANNPYVIVGAYEGSCSADQYPPIPVTPVLARAYEEGVLDASFGQVVSFASFYQTSFRIEVPLWHKLEDGMNNQGLNSQAAAPRTTARATTLDKGPSPKSSSDATKSPTERANRTEANAEEEVAEEESYVPATGQGCYSFEMSLLQRAAQTFAKRSVTDMYMQIARWLHIGLATSISRKSWHLLSKHRTRTITPLAMLRVQFERGYLSTEKSDRKKPYAATEKQGETVRDWDRQINTIIKTGYYTVVWRFQRWRDAQAEIVFFRTIAPVTPLPDADGASVAPETHNRRRTSASVRQ